MSPSCSSPRSPSPCWSPCEGPGLPPPSREAACYPAISEMDPIKVTREEVRRIARKAGTLRLYRSPWGCYLAVRLEAPLDLSLAEEQLSAIAGQYIVVDEEQGYCWVEDGESSFEAAYELVPERDTRPPPGSAGSSSVDS